MTSLANALAKSGIRAVELTFTTPGALDYLRAASASAVVPDIASRTACFVKTLNRKASS